MKDSQKGIWLWSITGIIGFLWAVYSGHDVPEMAAHLFMAVFGLYATGKAVKFSVPHIAGAINRRPPPVKK